MTPPQISGCSSASVRPRPHSTAWTGLARSPSATGWALRVRKNSLGGDGSAVSSVTMRRASLNSRVGRCDVDRRAGRRRARRARCPRNRSAPRPNSAASSSSPSTSHEAALPVEPSGSGRLGQVGSYNQSAGTGLSSGASGLRLPRRAPKPLADNAGVKSSQCRVWCHGVVGSAGCGSGGCGADRRPGGVGGVEVGVERDGVVGVALQRAEAVVVLLPVSGSSRVSAMAWVSSGCGLISMKVPLVGAGGGDRLAEPHRVAQVGHPVVGVEQRCVAGIRRRWR